MILINFINNDCTCDGIQIPSHYPGTNSSVVTEKKDSCKSEISYSKQTKTPGTNSTAEHRQREEAYLPRWSITHKNNTTQGL